MTEVEQYQQPAELAVADPTGGRLVAWAGAGRAAYEIARAIADTDFIPKHFKGKPGDIMAALMLSDELRLPPVSGLRSIYVISGTPALYARTMVALAMQHGHEVWTEMSTDAEVVVCGKRKGSEHVERASWTTARARKAGYTSNRKYDTDPQSMLYSKAAAEVARKIAPDVLSGVPYSVEDLELEQPEPAARVSRRQPVKRETPTVPEPEFDEPAPAPEPVAVPAETMITRAQSGKLHALLKECGITDREVGLAYVSQVIDRKIESTNELTKAEASRAIDQIEKEKEPAEPEPEPSEAWPAVAGAEQQEIGS